MNTPNERAKETAASSSAGRGFSGGPAGRTRPGGVGRFDFDFDRKPFMVIWEVTRACALACRHCRASAKVRAHPLELTHEESLGLIEQVARCEPGLFILTGGDPMRRLDLVSLVEHASGLGLYVALSPSATPEFVAADLGRLRQAGVKRISLSIDGASRETHDRFRGVPGTWDLTMRALDRAREAGIPVQVNTTFTRQNLGEFDEFVRLLERVKPAMWSVFQLVPTGRGKSTDMLTGLEMEELFQRLYEVSRASSFDVKTTEGHHYRRVVLQRSHDRSELTVRAPIGINDGKGFVFVSHIGEVQPSGFLPLSAGNVRTAELIDVYRNSELFRTLRDPSKLGGKCGLCEFNRVCGGSRARAYAVHGDYMAEEPLCVYQPARVRRSSGASVNAPVRVPVLAGGTEETRL